MKNSTRLHGRTSCWVLGGLGCLGLIIIAAVGVYMLGRAIERSGFGQMMKTASEAEQKFRPRMRALYEAIRRYEQDNNGKYPPNLKSLVPKYLTEEAISPVVLNDGTKYEFVYRPPKPSDPPDTVILEHKPPVKLVFSVSGETAETHITYQLRKDGKIREKTENFSTTERQPPQKGNGGS
ncbi:MAG: hypothetical protein CFK48_07145 [Armatimonadetes bacterium CP1_7O]|nr:MAG: hypothetical protein CFK48_07145 [Armatimonadetes bacterium CP1_7O]